MHNGTDRRLSARIDGDLLPEVTIQSLEDIEPNGYPNPFIAGSYERLVITKLKIGRAEFHVWQSVNLRTDENDRALEHQGCI